MKLGSILWIVALGLVGCEKPKSAPSGNASAPAASARQPGELLRVGDPAPAIQATAHNGQYVKLSDFAGKPVVVYFYPKDDTPGCTIEAEGIRDEWQALESTSAVVVGVSRDDNASHKAFADKYKLPFLLLPDTDGKIAEAFGVPMKLGFAKRVTFVIGKDGKIAKVFPEVKPQGHAQEVVAAVRGLSS